MADPSAVLERLRPAWARVDLTRLAENYRAMAATLTLPMMPVVKADAYGHGAARVARHLEALGAPMFAVAYVEEGVALRAAGVRVPIVVLAAFGPEQAGIFVEQDLTPVISTPMTLAAAMAAARERGRLSVHVKVDTGMTRLGFLPEQAQEVILRLHDAGDVRVEGLMTHLSSADEDARLTEQQLDRFDALIGILALRGVHPRWIHAAHSAGLAYLRPTHTLTRPGLLLYGLRPRPLSPLIAVRPVMSLVTRIAMIKQVPAGTAVSYGGRFVTSRPSRIASLPLGYADGVPRTRAMEESGHVTVGGCSARVTGAVCMDLTLIDVTDLPAVAEGDEAVIFGDAPTAWDVAEWGGAVAWQVLTAVGPRVPRVYVEDGRVVDVESRY